MNEISINERAIFVIKDHSQFTVKLVHFQFIALIAGGVINGTQKNMPKTSTSIAPFLNNLRNYKTPCQE